MFTGSPNAHSTSGPGGEGDSGGPTSTGSNVASTPGAGGDGVSQCIEGENFSFCKLLSLIHFIRVPFNATYRNAVAVGTQHVV